MAFRIPGESETQDRFRQRAEKARQATEAQERLRTDAIRRQIARREYQEDTRRWKERMEFDLYLLSETILEKLEAQRDKNLPEDPGGDWNEPFCEAVNAIPDARRFVEEMSIRIIHAEKGGTR